MAWGLWHMAFGPCPSTGDWFHRALGTPKPSYSHQPCTPSRPPARWKGFLLEPLGADWAPKAAKERPKVAKVHPKVAKVQPKVTKVRPEVDHKAPNTEKS